MGRAGISTYHALWFAGRLTASHPITDRLGGFLTSILNVVQARIERHYGRGHDRQAVTADLPQEAT